MALTPGRTTGALNHPNILALYDVGILNDTLYLVEELLDGTTLRDPLGLESWVLSPGS